MRFPFTYPKWTRNSIFIRDCATLQQCRGPCPCGDNSSCNKSGLNASTGSVKVLATFCRVPGISILLGLGFLHFSDSIYIDLDVRDSSLDNGKEELTGLAPIVVNMRQECGRTGAIVLVDILICKRGATRKQIHLRFGFPGLQIGKERYCKPACNSLTERRATMK